MRVRITKYLVLASCSLWLYLLLLPGIVGAAGVVSRGYIAGEGDLQLGMAVALSGESSADKPIVIPASTDNKTDFVGIVTALEDTLLAVVDKGSNINVTTSGEVQVFVSDLNGEVKKGDYLSLSPLKGILMRAGTEEDEAIGTALADMDVDKATTKSVNNSSDGQTSVRITQVATDLNPKTIASNKKNNSFLVVLGRSVTGKEVDALQVAVAFLIFFVLLIVEGSIMYGAIYSSIISLGRNPLSKAAVYKELAQVSVIALLVLGLGLGAIYLVLWA